MGGICCAQTHHTIDQKTINKSFKDIINENSSKSKKAYLDFDDFNKKFNWDQGSITAKDKKYKITYEVEILENISGDQIEKVRSTLDHLKTVSKNAIGGPFNHHF